MAADVEELQEFVSTKYIAELFGLENKDVQYYIRKGVIPVCKILGGYSYLIRIQHVPDQWPPQSN